MKTGDRDDDDVIETVHTFFGVIIFLFSLTLHPHLHRLRLVLSLILLDPAFPLLFPPLPPPQFLSRVLVFSLLSTGESDRIHSLDLTSLRVLFNTQTDDKDATAVSYIQLFIYLFIASNTL